MRAAIAVCILGAWVAHASLQDCTYKVGEKTFDFSSLINKTGHYDIDSVAYTTDTLAMDTLISDDKVNVKTYLQVCRNIDKSPHPNCTDPGTAYMLMQDNSCVSLGKIELAEFEPNPLKDGAFIAMYGGTVFDHVTRWSSHLYFICDKTATRGPYYEHYKSATKQVHFKIFTKLAC